ncbi:hypothetical protein QF035_009241 [Streptomyces umbrinus]|uniref:Peptidoglycan binding-like domain-containing protein n=1 Tax=Streptomyces umbrinus TaxID=67370 RepID=A0ABU0TA34_9ACTN|nr:peptidoglycan-binding domain-containing protein [Streptomyces umbrinus]MDQ1031659.1 hypothetical protein [Streptomyces umbrinus]
MGPHKTDSRRTVAGVGTTRPGQRQDGFEYVQLFLVELGYIPARSYEAGRLDDITALALAWFQEHSALTPTGVFDHSTRAEMLKSRCGLMRTPVLRASGEPRLANGQILRHLGGTSWDTIDTDLRTLEISVGAGDVYQLLDTGEIFRYPPSGGVEQMCHLRLPGLPIPVAIASSSTQLYHLRQRRADAVLQVAPTGRVRWGVVEVEVGGVTYENGGRYMLIGSAAVLAAPISFVRKEGRSTWSCSLERTATISKPRGQPTVTGACRTRSTVS